MQEIKIISDAVSAVTDIPSSAVASIFGVGLYARSKYQKWKENKEDKKHRALETVVKLQLDFMYSDAYKDIEGRIYYLYNQGERSVEVRHKEEINTVPFGAYKTTYKDALKETAFKIVFPCIMSKLKDDKKHYKGINFNRYIQDTGEDIRNTFVGVLGRKSGITEISKMVEEDTLTAQKFIKMYRKIIERAREQ